MRPGALLAVPPADAPALNASLTTEPARRLLSALSTFGAYVVDDTAWCVVAFSPEVARSRLDLTINLLAAGMRVHSPRSVASRTSLHRRMGSHLLSQQARPHPGTTTCSLCCGACEWLQTTHQGTKAGAECRSLHPLRRSVSASACFNFYTGTGTASTTSSSCNGQDSESDGNHWQKFVRRHAARLPVN